MLYWIWLTQIKGVGPVLQRTLLEKFNTPEDIYRASFSELLQCEGIGDKTAKRIIDARSLEKAHKLEEDTDRLNIKILTIDDSLYPEEAKGIKETPILLYYKGTLIKNSMGVAIVGARRCSEYGKMVTTEAASYLAKQKICVISGMAKGIDGYAHTACIKAGGYTIAVLGHGLDICYPSEHTELMEKIIQNGAGISEYPPGVKAESKHFPKRNLLISAWSHKVLIVEASEKSGALITAEFGKRYKREILGVPDNIYRKESIGSNRLIRDGAIPYLSEKQLLIENKYEFMRQMDNNIATQNRISKELDKVEKDIIEILKAEGPETVENLSVLLSLERMKLLEKISLMELEDKVILQGSMVTCNRGKPFLKDRTSVARIQRT